MHCEFKGSPSPNNVFLVPRKKIKIALTDVMIIWTRGAHVCPCLWNHDQYGFTFKKANL